MTGGGIDGCGLYKRRLNGLGGEHGSRVLYQNLNLNLNMNRRGYILCLSICVLDINQTVSQASLPVSLTSHFALRVTAVKANGHEDFRTNIFILPTHHLQSNLCPSRHSSPKMSTKNTPKNIKQKPLPPKIDTVRIRILTTSTPYVAIYLTPPTPLSGMQTQSINSAPQG